MERAEAFLRAGELDEALAALDEQLQAQPDDAAAQRLRIDVLIRLPGRAQDALVALNALPDLTGDDYVARYGALLPLGLPGVDDAILEGYTRFPGQPALADLTLTILQRRGASDQALALLADLPKTAHWLSWSGTFYALKGDDRVAAEHFCSALDQLEDVTDPLLKLQRAALLLRRADAYRRLKQYADADADYLAAEAIIPDDPMIPFNRGLLIFEQGNLRRALPLCRDALDHAPDALRDHMRHVLLDGTRYRTLAQALLG
ncbi:MAG: tetratricopeptide repeat protein [Anaerolineae bacterium]